MAGGHIDIVGLTKTFDDFVAVQDMHLEVPAGEFFSMLGPSGCGKTTTLRMIAGFENPNSGQIIVDGVDMRGTPPNKRNVNTVFQNYMIFPHLNVFENVAFGLRRQHTARAEIKTRVHEALELVQLGHLANRRPAQLSGGQQQRVALARALVLQPSVLLLDEPLGALDAKLRRRLQLELKALQQTVGITFVYVTHDQEEALTMSDQIAVMNNGRVEQVASPREVYEEPATEFVADFLGVSNLLEASVAGRSGDSCQLRIGDFTLSVNTGELDLSGEVKCVVRPERVRILDYKTTGANQLPGMVERVVYMGSATQVILRLAIGTQLHALTHNDGTQREYQQGTAVQVQLPAEALRILSPPTAQATESTATTNARGNR